MWPRVAKYIATLAEQFHPRNVAGGMCRRCGGLLESREHLVDLAGMDMAGICSCEYWQIVVRKKLEPLKPHERMCFEETCQHVMDCQRFAYQLALRLHEAERLAVNGNGRKEEDAP